MSILKNRSGVTLSRPQVTLTGRPEVTFSRPQVTLTGRLTTQFIVFDTTFNNEKPLHSFNNFNEVLDFIHMIKDNNATTYSLITGKNAEKEYVNSNLINITVLMLVLTKSGICKESKKLLFDPSTDSFKDIDTNLFENIKTIQKTNVINDIQMYTDHIETIKPAKSYVPITTKTHVPITTKTHVPTTTKTQLHLAPDRNIDQRLPAVESNKNDKKKNPELSVEITKLFDTLAKVGDSEAESKDMNNLNKIFDNLEEEALLDEEIRKTKDVLDAKLNKKKSKKTKKINNDIVYDSDDSDNSDDSDDQDNSNNQDISNKLNDSSRGNPSGLDNLDSLDNLDNDPMHLDYSNKLNELIGAKNTLKQSIEKKELVITKANEKLNEELFLQRCRDQDERCAKQKYNEKLSILESDKNTYLRMQSKIKKGTLKESNISPFFSYKYQIIKFMEENKLICLKKGADIEKELYVFDQLNKVVDICEKNTNEIHEENNDEDCKNDKDNKDSKIVKNDKIDKDPLDEIDDEYLPLCQIFMDKILENDDLIVTEKTVHSLLNNDPDLKKKLFIDPANQSVFFNDSSAESHRNDKDDQMSNSTKQMNNNTKQTNKRY
jgi:hypothetical protein